MKTLLGRFGFNSLVDVRAAIYHIMPVLTAALVTLGVLTKDQATLWVGLVAAIAGPGLAFLMARNSSNLRTALYALLAAGQAIVIGYGLATSEQVGNWVPILSSVIALIGGTTAIVNTPVTSQFSKLANAGGADPKAPVVQ
jgi:uncharacterized membrane protein HdeD (DUF308 family)